MERPLNILIILGHPRPGSFNHALARAAADQARAMGHQVTLRDLHAEGFDPILPADEMAKGAPLPPAVAEHCRLLSQADGVVIIHPNWWGMPPAMLKGWIDRVIRPGVAYEFLEGDNGQGVPRGLLKARAAVVLNTGDTDEIREIEVFGDPLERLWKDCIFGLCGVREVHRQLFGIVVTSTAQERLQWLERAKAMVARAFPAG